MNEILIIIFLILLNGLFSMSEIAVISARKSSLASEEKKGSKAATTALKLACQPEKFLSTVQIGITLIGILTGIYSGATLSEDFGKLLLEWHVPAVYARPLAQTIIVILVTYFTIIFGELVPKRIGMSSAERISKFIAPFMYFISVIAAPFVWILAKSTTAIFSLLGIKDGGSRVTEDEIKSIIQEGAEDGEVQEVEQDIMERALILGDLKVNALMTYRADMVALDVSMGREEVKAVVRDTVHEMYPVVDRSFDDVKGVVSLKSLVFHLDDENFDFRSVIVPATFFHETMSVYDALAQMKEKRNSQALICDEFGCCQGIITLRDILEGLVGSIESPHEEPDIVKRADSESWLVDGRCSFYDFLTYFDQEELYEQGSYNTISGLLLDLLEHIPHAGEKVRWNGFSFEVVDMDGARIDKVLVERTEPDFTSEE